MKACAKPFSEGNLAEKTPQNIIIISRYTFGLHLCYLFSKERFEKYYMLFSCWWLNVVALKNSSSGMRLGLN